MARGWHLQVLLLVVESAHSGPAMRTLNRNAQGLASALMSLLLSHERQTPLGMEFCLFPSACTGTGSFLNSYFRVKSIALLYLHCAQLSRSVLTLVSLLRCSNRLWCCHCRLSGCSPVPGPEMPRGPCCQGQCSQGVWAAHWVDAATARSAPERCNESYKVRRHAST